jgi:hypothetical protein
MHRMIATAVCAQKPSGWRAARSLKDPHSHSHTLWLSVSTQRTGCPSISKVRTLAGRGGDAMPAGCFTGQRLLSRGPKHHRGIAALRPGHGEDSRLVFLGVRLLDPRHLVAVTSRSLKPPDDKDDESCNTYRPAKGGISGHAYNNADHDQDKPNTLPPRARARDPDV